jgi:uncharacterized protein YxjI
MRQKILSIGDDYWIENAEGRQVYRVDGKALRLRRTLEPQDAQTSPGPLLLGGLIRPVRSCDQVPS